MHFLLETALTFCVLADIVIAQSPPGFSPASSAKLNLAFGSTTINSGQQIGINVPADAPTIAATSALTGTYLLALVDPDATTPQNPILAQLLHFLQPGLSFASTANNSIYPATIAATPAVPYQRPSPPPTSAPHRYIALLFVQPPDFSVPRDFQQYNATFRTNFNISKFAAEANLGDPVEANYFLVSNMTTNSSTSGGNSSEPSTTSSTTASTGTGMPFTGAGSLTSVGLGSVVIGILGAILTL